MLSWAKKTVQIAANTNSNLEGARLINGKLIVSCSEVIYVSIYQEEIKISVQSDSPNFKFIFSGQGENFQQKFSHLKILIDWLMIDKSKFCKHVQSKIFLVGGRKL